MARRTSVKKTVYSKHKEAILSLLKVHGFIVDFAVENDGNKRFFTIALREVHTHADIPVVKFFSRPSRPWYISVKDIVPVAGGRGIGIISTSKGLMDTVQAKREGVGGELIAQIY